MMTFPVCGVHSPSTVTGLNLVHLPRKLIHDAVLASSKQKWPISLLKSLGAFSLVTCLSTFLMALSTFQHYDGLYLLH